MVALERDAQGRTSWPAFGGADEGDRGDGGGEAAPKLSVGDVTVTDGRVGYRDAVADYLAAKAAGSVTAADDLSLGSMREDTDG